MRPALLLPCVAACLIAVNLRAIVIDDFNSGFYESDPGSANFIQDGLPAASVAGGARDWRVNFSGPLQVGGSQGVLSVQDDFHFSDGEHLVYGSNTTGGAIAPLNLDLTAGGGAVFIVNVIRAYSATPQAGNAPAKVTLNVFSGAGTANTGSGFLQFQPAVSENPVAVELRYEDFTYGDSVDFSDVDMIDVRFSALGPYELELDDILTDAGIPLIAGDFNKDGAVDAADYSVWRDGLGDAYDLDDYQVWRDHYGATAAAPTAAQPAPAPTARLLLSLCLAAVAAARRGDSGRRRHA